MILHIPSGTYVSKINVANKQNTGRCTNIREVKTTTVWGFDIPSDAVPIKFVSKSKAKLWLRQKASGKRGVLFMMIEITE
jgi:hypothetical protein